MSGAEKNWRLGLAIWLGFSVSLAVVKLWADPEKSLAEAFWPLGFTVFMIAAFSLSYNVITRFERPILGWLLVVLSVAMTIAMISWGMP